MPFVTSYSLDWRGRKVPPGTVLEVEGAAEERRAWELQRARAVRLVETGGDPPAAAEPSAAEPPAPSAEPSPAASEPEAVGRRVRRH